MQINVGIFFDSDQDGGGGFYQSLSVATALSKIDNKRFKFYFICTDQKNIKKLSSLGVKTIFFPLKKICRIYQKLITSELIRIFLKKIGYKNPFEKFMKKKGIELLIFLGPSYFIQLCEKINFIVNIYDINHIFENYFPEYKNQEIFDLKNRIITKTTQQAFKILVDTERSKFELVKYFNCLGDKIIIQPFTPYLPKLFEKIKTNTDFKKTTEDLALPKSERFIFYPAQFWAHKNHKYILNALSILLNQNYTIKVVFCGSDKGNLENIKRDIIKFNLNDNVKIYSFLSEEQVIALYTNCFAVVMPTFVARSTMPLYESFFFEKTIFYSKNILDKNLEKYVTVIDLNNPRDLSEQIINLIDKGPNTENLKDAKKIYDENCNETKLKKNYENILEQYFNVCSIWKN